MSSGVYEIRSPSGKRYIGSAKHLNARKNQHFSQLRRNVHTNKILQNAWNRYGEDNMIFSCLIICTVKDLLFYEQLLFDKLTPEYNVLKLAGNNLGYRHSIEQRQKWSKNRRGLKQSAETKKRRSTAHHGRKNTEEAKQKMREAALGRKMSAEACAKMSAYRKGRTLSAEHRAKLSAALKGKTVSVETREKIRLSNIVTKRRKRLLATI